MGASKRGKSKGGEGEFVVTFSAGRFIFREGEPGGEMYIIQTGEVEIVKVVQGEPHRLAILEEGDFFGEMAILEDLPRTAAARAHTDCALLQIDESTFDQLIRHNPEISIRMLRKLCHRLRATNPVLLEADGVGSIEPADTAEEPIKTPEAPKTASTFRLVHGLTGTEFPLADGEESTIGRFDPVTGLTPTINLRPIDVQRSCSRRHARILTRGNQAFVREEIATANGTFVNGVRLKTGKEIEIHDGDEVRFGKLDLVFRTG